MSKQHAIPDAILTAMGNRPTVVDDYTLNSFATSLARHAASDARTGYTGAYHHTCASPLGDILTPDEFAAVADAGFVPSPFIAGDRLNRHYEHSIEQFFAECQLAWNNHVTRTDALLGTPAGRINT